VALLCFVNLINYMDRYTVSSKFFRILRAGKPTEREGSVRLTSLYQPL
jgi:hypothetical protein